MITYESNPSMKQYIDRIKEAGEIVRSAKHEILGIGEKALMTTEEAAQRIESHVQNEFVRLSERLPKYVSNDICGTIISVVHLALNHPELINDIEYAINGAMKRW
jgi:predicted Ser/Thr protein kinase